ncbi:Zinc finger C3HC4 type domain-containing protein 1 [Elsinoe fawcettii]|nr:Zinc finger C3HC4 type domain-containing protein 1 [Elsinoe fawcettii]
MPSLKRRADNTDDSASRKRHNTRRTAIAEPEARSEEGNAMEVPIRSGSVSEPVVAEAITVNDEHVKTLKLLHDDFDVLRQTLTCKICEKLFYEPYVLHCGHTYCYRCLSTWFNSNSKMSCPNCRVRITQTPAPSYAIKDMVLVFMKRAELLPDGETVQEHEIWRKEEEDHLTADKNNKDPRSGGLFKGRFNGRRGVLRPLVDPTDNVARCPNCHWELEDDSCPHCGIHFDSEGYESASDDYDSMDDMDGELEAVDDDPAVWGWGHDLDRMDGIGGRSDGSDSEDGQAAFQRAMRGFDVRDQVHNAVHGRQHANALRANHPLGARSYANHGWPVVPSGIHDLDDHDEDNDDEDDDEAGSMDGFVVNDDESEPAGSHQTISSDDEDTEGPRAAYRRRDDTPGDEVDEHFPWERPANRNRRHIIQSSDSSDVSNPEDDSSAASSSSGDEQDSSEMGNTPSNPAVLDDSDDDSMDSALHFNPSTTAEAQSSNTASDSDDEPPRPAMHNRRLAAQQRRRQPNFQSAARSAPRTTVARSGRQRDDDAVNRVYFS